jgi:hypothetical protein
MTQELTKLYNWEFSAMAASLKTCLGKTHPYEIKSQARKEYNQASYSSMFLHHNSVSQFKFSYYSKF